MEYARILSIIETFYDIAKKDILIGYHFRVIEDFDTHIPRIADFWNLQLNGKLEDRTHLPFQLLPVHKALNINKGEIGRWVKLFKENLENNHQLTKDEMSLWNEKVDFFSEKLTNLLFN